MTWSHIYRHIYEHIYVGGATNLLESDVVGVFSEALTTEAQAIFADQTVSVGAGPAVVDMKKKIAQ